MYEYDGSLDTRRVRNAAKCISFPCLRFSLGGLLADGLLYFRGGKVRENNGSETWHGEVGRKTELEFQFKVFKEHKEQFISKLCSRPIPCAKLCHK